MSDENGFSAKLNGILGVPSIQEVRAEVYADAGQDTSSSVYDWDESACGPSMDQLSTSPSLFPSTPARKGKRQKAKEQLPVLFKKRKIPETTTEDTIMQQVQRAYLGSTKVLTAHLKLGPQLRGLRESFVEELMVQMRQFPGHFYQPLCVIIDTLDNVSHFRESNANGFHYRVIGGCHNFTAAERLSLIYPTEDVYKIRNCCIYKDQLGEEAVLWLANRHNTIGEYRHSMSLTEKIQLCRNIFENSGMNRENNRWHSTVSTVLGQKHSKGILRLLCKLAEMNTGTYNLLQKMLSLHSSGKLKNQKLSDEELVKGPSMKPYILGELPALPFVAAQSLLTSLIDAEISLPEFRKEAKLLLKLQTVQQMFLDLMGLRTWDEAMELFPMQTTREHLEHYTTLSLRKIPEKLKMLCTRLRHYKATGCLADYKGELGAVGIAVCCDALDLSEEMLSGKIADFSGADLIILDLPKDWHATEVKNFLNIVTSLNVNKNLHNFTIAVLCETGDIPIISKAIKETKHFADPMEGFYAVPSGKKSCHLNKCVHGMVLARRKTGSGQDSQVITWTTGNSDNLVVVEDDGPFIHDGTVVDPEQKPLLLYKELVSTLSIPGQWVLDACCGTGTGIIAALQEGRNVVGLEKDSGILSLMGLRVTHEVGGKRVKSVLDGERGDGEGGDGEEEDGEDDDGEDDDGEDGDFTLGPDDMSDLQDGQEQSYSSFSQPC